MWAWHKSVMAVWRNKVEQSNLETQQWKPLSIQGHSFLVKGTFSVDMYEILLTDFSVMWEESLSEQNILKRSKSLNPLIEAPTSVILKQLSIRILESENSQSLCSYKCKCSETEMIITIEGPLHHDTDPQYMWQLKLTRAPPLLLKNHLVSPLLSCSLDLLHRNDELIKIIKKKDAEINDYREGGAVLSRKHFLTLPFEEDSFQNDMVKCKNFKEYSMNPVDHVGSKWQKVYQDIVTCRHWYNTQDISIEESSPNNTNVLLSMKSPTKSPMKRALEESPSMDVEKSRRKALEKRLEESKSKMKKKKKRLM